MKPLKCDERQTQSLLSLSLSAHTGLVPESVDVKQLQNLQMFFQTLPACVAARGINKDVLWTSITGHGAAPVITAGFYRSVCCTPVQTFIASITISTFLHSARVQLGGLANIDVTSQQQHSGCFPVLKFPSTA